MTPLLLEVSCQEFGPFPDETKMESQKLGLSRAVHVTVL